MSTELTSEVKSLSTLPTLVVNDVDLPSSVATLVLIEPTEPVNMLSLDSLVDSSDCILFAIEVTSPVMLPDLTCNELTAKLLVTSSEEILLCNDVSTPTKELSIIVVLLSSLETLVFNDVISPFVVPISDANAVDTEPILVFSELSPNTLDEASELISEVKSDSTPPTLVLIDVSS